MRNSIAVGAILALTLGLVSVSTGAMESAEGRRIKVVKDGLGIMAEIYSENIVHFEVSINPAGQDVNKPIYTTPMVATPELKPTQVQVRDNGLSTTRLDVTIETDTLCVRVFDKKLGRDLVRNCPFNTRNTWKGLTLESRGFDDVYGLGNYFRNNSADGTWNGGVWDPKAYTHGNSMQSFEKGSPSHALFPIIYALGSGTSGYALFMDQIYKQMWTFNQSPWHVQMWGDQMRWYVIAGDSVKDLRATYMALTGKPPLPPKKALGLWVSEFGYQNWGEVENVVNSLRRNRFPLDGLGMDLQWFGGKFYARGADTQGSRMGKLQFDPGAFGDAANVIKHLRDDNGVTLMTIEESYVSAFSDEHRELRDRWYMARNCWDNSPVYLDMNPWWGVGGMIDWTHPDAGKFWHDRKRQALYDIGVTFHWTDLGEPEMYNQDACYYGFPELGKNRHGDIHNIYNFKWIESIARGYRDHSNRVRPYVMSRSGTSGIQRFGAGMWSGDLAANMANMRAHYNSHMHMSMSGIDYFSSDVGGFHRRSDTLDGDQNELYTQWFANASLFDFPVRPHVWNLGKNLKTAPDSIGRVESNRFNIRQRYALSPYYYSLAYRASVDATPVIPPMVYYFQEDQRVRSMGNQKMIGPFLMGAMVASYGENSRTVYLPKGKWFNFHTQQAFNSRGEEISGVPEFEHRQKNDQWIFRTPLFARAGALIPMMYVDGKTMNVLGRREGQAAVTDLHLRVYPDETASNFELYEDDGQTVDYRNGRSALTRLEQKLSGQTAVVDIRGTRGTFDGLPAQRNQILTVIFDGRTAKSVSVNGARIDRCDTLQRFNESDRCWRAAGRVVSIKSGTLATAADKHIEIETQDLGSTGT